MKASLVAAMLLMLSLGGTGALAAGNDGNAPQTTPGQHWHHRGGGGPNGATPNVAGGTWHHHRHHRHHHHCHKHLGK